MITIKSIAYFLDFLYEPVNGKLATTHEVGGRLVARKMLQ